jgi:hypothetical protein
MDDEDLASLIAGDDTAAAPEAAETPAPVPPVGAEEAAGGAPEVRDEAPEPPAAAAPAAEPGHVPIGTLLEERERRQGLERRLVEIEAAQRASQVRAAEAELPPDQQQQAQLWALRRDKSREMLVGRLGEDEAKALDAWGFEACERDPHFNAQVYASRNPYEFIRQARQREQLLAEVRPEDLEDFRAWKAGRAGDGASPGAPPPPGLRPAASPVNGGGAMAPTPPRSLATAPNAGGPGAQGEIPVGPGAAFASTIRR